MCGEIFFEQPEGNNITVVIHIVCGVVISKHSVANNKQLQQTPRSIQ